jgi:hypothetical protein
MAPRRSGGSWTVDQDALKFAGAGDFDTMPRFRRRRHECDGVGALRDRHMPAKTNSEEEPLPRRARRLYEEADDRRGQSCVAESTAAQGGGAYSFNNLLMIGSASVHCQCSKIETNNNRDRMMPQGLLR